MHTSLPFLAATALVLSAPIPARADILQFQFSGVVDDIPASLAGEFAVGEAITGVFSVDTTPNGFLYNSSGLSLTIGGDYSVTGQVGALRVLDDFGGWDFFHASFDGPITGTAINGLAPVEFDLGLILPATAFSTGAVPLSVPVENAIGAGSMSIDFAPDDDDTLNFRVTSLVAVPEPSLVASRRRSAPRQ